MSMFNVAHKKEKEVTALCSTGSGCTGVHGPGRASAWPTWVSEHESNNFWRDGCMLDDHGQAWQVVEELVGRLRRDIGIIGQAEIDMGVGGPCKDHAIAMCARRGRRDRLEVICPMPHLICWTIYCYPPDLKYGHFLFSYYCLPGYY
jgi:hypothetical protein